MERKDLIRTLQEVLEDRFGITKELEESTHLFADGINLDSLMVLELIMQLEEKLEIIIPDEELNPNVFVSVETLVDLLMRMSHAKAS